MTDISKIMMLRDNVSFHLFFPLKIWGLDKEIPLCCPTAFSAKAFIMISKENIFIPLLTFLILLITCNSYITE